jgi:hypothetical protein
MEEQHPIPSPAESGVAGTQAVGTAVAVPPDEPPLQQVPIARELVGLASRNTKAFGSETAGILVSAAAQQLAHQLDQANIALREKTAESDRRQDLIADLRERNGRLEEQLTSERQNRNLRGVAVLAGTALLGIGIDSVSKGAIGLGSSLLVVGALLLFMSFFGRREAST